MDERNPSDSFDLVYICGIHGWSSLYIIMSGKFLAIRITHISSDPIGDLIHFCEDILQGKDTSLINLHDEPGSTLITASVIKSQRHLIHVEFWSCPENTLSPARCKLLLELDIKTTRFVGLLYRQLDKVRWLYADKQYQTDRADFPHQQFKQLETLMKTQHSECI